MCPSMFNRKRVGDVQYLNLDTYNKENHRIDQEAFTESLTEVERIPSQKFKRVVTGGKGSKPVPILFSKRLQKFIACLLNIRETTNIVPKSNPYMFANPGSGNKWMAGTSIIRNLAEKCGAKYPSLLTSTKFRKHIATTLQLMSMQLEEMEQIATFMGHTKETHAEFYRYLASGSTFTDLQYTFRIGIKTVSYIVREVCTTIWSELSEIYMNLPSKEEWLIIAKKFESAANFPLCLGAVDGKHIRVIKPEESGSMFLNYKHYFSVVLMAVVDSNYNYIFIDVGAYGKDCDSAIFKETEFWKSLLNNRLNIPESTYKLGTECELPYVFVADEAFALNEHLLRPFGGHQLDEVKRTFNYRLTRARRYVECAFGIMVNEWRILHRPLNVSTDLAVDIVKTCCLLQNFIHKEEGILNMTSDDSPATPIPTYVTYPVQIL